MGIYKKVKETCGNPGDLYANIRGDGDKATVHSPFGTRVYQKAAPDSIDNNKEIIEDIEAGVYKKISGCDSGDLYANVRGDGDRATIHSPFGTRIYQRVTSDNIDDDILLKIQSSPSVTIDDLVPYLDTLGDYIFLTNKPKINGITLEGNLSTDDLKIYSKIDANCVYLDDGETVQEKYNKGESGIGGGSYLPLTDKPTINGVVVSGNLSTTDLGIINDTGSSDQSTWSSAYIQKQIEEQASVVKALVGTDEEPVVIADLPVGSYVISGKIQSSQDNVTTIRVSKPRQYIINRDVEGTTVLWEQNPYTASLHYITFYHEGPDAPQEQTVNVITREDLATASFDCGDF